MMVKILPGNNIHGPSQNQLTTSEFRMVKHKVFVEEHYAEDSDRSGLRTGQ